MFCNNCGKQLDEDAQFCPECGKKNTPEVDTKKTEKQGAKNNEGIIKKLWNKLANFERFLAICILVGIALSLFALLFGKVGSLVFALVQVVVFVVVWLLHRSIIKTVKTWIKPVLIVIAFALIIPYYLLFGTNKNTNENTYNWNDIVLHEHLPSPEVVSGNITVNNKNDLSIRITNVSKEKYNNYIEACKEKGYTIDAELVTGRYEAYNADGYKLHISFYEYSSEMSIKLEAPKVFETITWPKSKLANIVPTLESNKGEIIKDTEEQYFIYVGNVTKQQFNAYIDKCIESGFDIENERTDSAFTAKNKDKYKISVNYEGNNVISICVYDREYQVELEIKCVENLFFSKYDVDVIIGLVTADTVKHGETKTITKDFKKGDHTIRFRNSEDKDVSGEIKITVTESAHITIEISCESDTINAKVLTDGSENENSGDSSDAKKIVIPKEESEYIGENYTAVEKEFRDLGFSVIEHKSANTEYESKHNTVSSVEIKDWFLSGGNFKKGDTFASDATIVIWHYEYKEPEQPKPVFYSTNDYETAKKGISGVFSYKNKSGSYDIYWIIDFDEGYVYYFVDGNGDDFCDKLKIESGTLNNCVNVTYHDGTDKWNEKLFFKYENHPETLVVVDGNGFRWEYTTTDLDDALEVRNTKKIKER